MTVCASAASNLLTCFVCVLRISIQYWAAQRRPAWELIKRLFASYVLQAIARRCGGRSMRWRASARRRGWTGQAPGALLLHPCQALESP